MLPVREVKGSGEEKPKKAKNKAKKD